MISGARRVLRRALCMTADREHGVAMREEPTGELAQEGRASESSDGGLVTRVRSGSFTAIGDPHADLERAVETMSREDLAALVLGARDALQEQDARFAHMLDIGSALGNALHIDDLLDISRIESGRALELYVSEIGRASCRERV